jgi:hypothetical protein
MDRKHTRVCGTRKSERYVGNAKTHSVTRIAVEVLLLRIITLYRFQGLVKILIGMCPKFHPEVVLRKKQSKIGRRQWALPTNLDNCTLNGERKRPVARRLNIAEVI